MNRKSNKDSHDDSANETSSRVSNNSLMNGSGQLLYRRSPIPHQSTTQHQPSFEQSSSSLDFNYEEISENNNSVDNDINDLSRKFYQLQRKIESLTETQTNQDERYKRSRQENEALLTRIHGLEDQLRELELSSEIRAKEDEKRFKETMAKQMKSQSLEFEQHLHANFLLQQENFQLKNDLLKNEASIKTLRDEKEMLELELQEKNSELNDQDQEIHKLKLLIKSLKDEENIKSNIINILHEELEDSHNISNREQQFQNNDQSVASTSNNSYNKTPQVRLTSSRRSSLTSGFDDEFLPSNSVNNNKVLKDIDGLEISLSKVREENKRLKELNEELQAQLLNAQLEEGMSLVQEGNKSYSLADEMGDIDVQKLMKALKEQQDDNVRLRKYMDEILLKIVEKNPEILDKTTSSASKNNHNQSVET